ncbi:MAG: hypothetical protein WKF48_05400 [Solirubrobacteraceae bacterium]
MMLAFPAPPLFAQSSADGSSDDVSIAHAPHDVGDRRSYDDDLAGVQRTILAAVGSVADVETDPAPQAFVYEFGESSINFAVRFWHGAEILSMWRARDAVAQAVTRKLDEEGYTIPFPQRTLWFGPGETQLAVRDVTPRAPSSET